jgi:RHS repeat-associated protein
MDNSISPRQGFIGKELDSGSDLADHGVRKYDYRTGRFMAIDPLWEKYRSLNTYQYAANNPMIMSDPSGLDFTVRPDGNTITISMTILVENADAFNSATKGKEFWEAQSNKYQYTTTINGQEKTFDVVFSITVLLNERPDDQYEATNPYSINADNDGSVFNNTTDPQGIRAGVVFNKPGGHQEVHIKESAKNRKSTAAHEIGHLMGLGHSETGLMVDDGNSNSFRLNTNASMINQILNSAVTGTFESESMPRAYAPAFFNTQGTTRNKN